MERASTRAKPRLGALRVLVLEDSASGAELVTSAGIRVIKRQ